MKAYFQGYRRIRTTGSLYTEIDAKDEQGNTPFKIAMEKGDDELIHLLLMEGAHTERYSLYGEDPDLVPFMQAINDQVISLSVENLSPSSFPVIFEAIAQSSSLVSLRYWEEEEERQLTGTRLDFFQGLAEALQRNFQRYVTFSQQNLEGTVKGLRLLILDISWCEELTVQEVQPLFTCLGLKTLWLPPSLLDYVDEQKQNLLHFLVQKSPMSKNIAGALIEQGVALSSRDHKGRTPVELARELGHATGNLEMAIFLEQAVKKKLSTIPFGKKDWEKYFGKVGKEPPLPRRILEVLESPCPIWPNKKVADTHFLTLIPEKVNGKSLTLKYLKDLVKNPKGDGNKTAYKIDSAVKIEHGFRPSGPSYWVLMTKNVLPNTGDKSYDMQLSMLNTYTARAPEIPGLGEYKPPKALEATASILMEYVRSGVRLYSDLKDSRNDYLDWDMKRCEESLSKEGGHVLIGGRASSNLSVTFSGMDAPLYGLGGVRKCLDL